LRAKSSGTILVGIKQNEHQAGIVALAGISQLLQRELNRTLQRLLLRQATAFFTNRPRDVDVLASE
jgi:hypothetical protein